MKGQAARIREALLEHGPLSLADLVAITELPARDVSRALSNMTRNGTVRRKPARYDYYRRAGRSYPEAYRRAAG